ncbi:hypothetical protein EDC01DRAFT_480143 [Geopyxis carbonaria]|nr:hypothetical protein EDC01DRAFT_480143 [Geopyxis carbonaria]
MHHTASLLSALTALTAHLYDHMNSTTQSFFYFFLQAALMLPPATLMASSLTPKPQTTGSKKLTASANLTLPGGKPFSDGEGEGPKVLQPTLDVDGVDSTRRRRNRNNRRRYARARARARAMDDFGAADIEILREKFPVMGVVEATAEAPAVKAVAEKEYVQAAVDNTAFEDTTEWYLPSGIPSGPKPKWERKYSHLVKNFRYLS